MQEVQSTLARLLIVDDEPAHFAALCDTLRRRGYTATGATSGAEVLRNLKRGDFDILVTDLSMPQMDGIALLRAAQLVDPDLMAIVMTGHGTVNTAVEAMKQGAVDYVLKPFNLTTLVPVIERAYAIRRLRVTNAALLQRLMDRTAELEHANRELEAFAHSISHDLRAPLRAIDGFSQILASAHATDLSPAALRLLGSISGNVKRMAELIDSLLRLARVGRAPLGKVEVDLGALARQVVAEQIGDARDAAARDVHLQIDALPPARGDPELLRQVLVNLLSNALKFTREVSPAQIRIAGERTGAQCQYLIEDNGAGFDMRHAHKLFGMFERLHASNQFEGVGIGLSIVQRIVERHGGRISATGEVGKGACFTFTLPAAD